MQLQDKQRKNNLQTTNVAENKKRTNMKDIDIDNNQDEEDEEDQEDERANARAGTALL